ncbi:MAG: hypothetical protein QXZ07_06245 [Nitrososphaerales archaeon]
MIYYETKLAEFIPLTTTEEIKRRKNNGSPSVQSRVVIPEFIKLANLLGFEWHGKKRLVLYSDDREAYLRLLVYAVVRQSIRSEVKAHRLIELVKKLPYTELKYWTSIFSRHFNEYENRRALYKSARAFREVYELDV